MTVLKPVPGTVRPGPAYLRPAVIATVPNVHVDTDSEAERGVAAAVEELAAGRPVLLVGDDGRVDLVASAETMTPALMAFLVRHSSGFVCVALPGERADALGIPAQVADGRQQGIPFGVTVDAAKGVTTGISATDRCRTAALLAAPDTIPADFTRPGHVVPLRTSPGGILRHRRPAEAAVDLAALSGLSPAAVVATLEIDSPSGGVGRRAGAAAEFAAQHGLVCVTLDDVGGVRARREVSVLRTGSAHVEIPAGTFTAVGYRPDDGDVEHVAFVHGPVADRPLAVLVHVHRDSGAEGAFASAQAAWTAGPRPMPSLSSALERVRAHGAGVVVWLRDPLRSAGVAAVLDACVGAAYPRAAAAAAAARAGVSSRILVDLGVRQAELLASDPALAAALAAAGVELRGEQPTPIRGQGCPR